MAMTTRTVTINETTLRNLEILAGRNNMTLDEVTSEMLQRGAKDAVYRSERNARVWQERKEKDARLAHLEQLEMDRALQARAEARRLENEELAEEAAREAAAQ